MGSLLDQVHGTKTGGSSGSIVLSHEGLFTHNNETFSEDQLIGAASLTSREVSDAQICAVLNLTENQLTILRGSPQYQTEIAEQTKTVVMKGIGTDNQWDQLESAALTGIMDDLNRGHVLETKELLMIASIANKAKRRNGAKAGEQQGAQINIDARMQTVNLKLPGVLVQRLSGLANTDENTIEEKVLTEAVLEKKYAEFQDMSLSKDDVSRVLNVDVDKPQQKTQTIKDEFLEIVQGVGVVASDAG